MAWRLLFPFPVIRSGVRGPRFVTAGSADHRVRYAPSKIEYRSWKALRSGDAQAGYSSRDEFLLRGVTPIIQGLGVGKISAAAPDQ